MADVDLAKRQGMVKGDEVRELGKGARFFKTLWALLECGLLLCGHEELFVMAEQSRDLV